MILVILIMDENLKQINYDKIWEMQSVSNWTSVNHPPINY